MVIQRDTLCDRLLENANGYVDVRSEEATTQTLVVRNHIVEKGIRSNRQGYICRVAGETEFHACSEPDDFKPQDTAFSRFVKESFLELGSEPLFDASVFDHQDIPESLIRLAQASAPSKLQCRFFWETRAVELQNNLKHRARKTERAQILRIEWHEDVKAGRIHLRRYLFDPSETSLKMTMAETEQAARLLRDAAPSYSWTGDVVLDPTVTSVLIHELFGHTCEADGWLFSQALPALENITPDFVTIRDVPRCRGGIAFMEFDDEGVVSRDEVLVEGGCLTNMLHSLETAFRFKVKPNGRARARDFRYIPMTRMTNIEMLPGRESPEDLFAQVKEGIYLVGTLGAINFPQTLQIQCQYGYRIRNGKLGQPILAPTLHGDKLAIAQNIRAVANDTRWIPDGGCLGGDQFLHRSGRAAPHILLSNLIVG